MFFVWVDAIVFDSEMKLGGVEFIWNYIPIKMIMKVCITLYFLVNAWTTLFSYIWKVIEKQWLPWTVLGFNYVWTKAQQRKCAILATIHITRNIFHQKKKCSAICCEFNTHALFTFESWPWQIGCKLMLTGKVMDKLTNSSW